MGARSISLARALYKSGVIADGKTYNCRKRVFQQTFDFFVAMRKGGRRVKFLFAVRQLDALSPRTVGQHELALGVYKHVLLLYYVKFIVRNNITDTANIAAVTALNVQKQILHNSYYSVFGFFSQVINNARSYKANVAILMIFTRLIRPA